LPESSFFLLGPRGTGKSTFLKAMLPGAVTVNLLEERTYFALNSKPGAFAEILAAANDGDWVIIDEVQRIPELLNEVHNAIVTRNLSFALCGSSARKLKRSGTNLLAGRALQRFMGPFLPFELGQDFSTEKALSVGLLPVVWMSKSPRETLQSYVALYLKEEIQAEAIVRNLPGFARFLKIASLFHGQTLNASSVARDAGVSRTTILGYLSVLEDTLMSFMIPAYEGRLRVREKKSPKFYIFDCGVAQALRGEFYQPPRDEMGRHFEGLVAQILRGHNHSRPLFETMYYWSPAEAKNTEVDFLLQRGELFVAIEAKLSPDHPDSFDGLKAIQNLKGLTRRILVVPDGFKRQRSDGIEILPLRDFANDLTNLF
jgi:predicted AAA+ superfamily ATPase